MLNQQFLQIIISSQLNWNSCICKFRFGFSKIDDCLDKLLLIKK